MTLRLTFGAAVAALVAVSCSPQDPGAPKPAEEAAATLKHNHFTGALEIDPQAGTLAADWTITVIEPQLESITYLLNRSYEDIRVGGDVTGYELVEAEIFDQQIWNIVIQLKPASGVHRKINISYGGELLPEPMENRINTISPDKVELTVDSLWHPFDGRFTEQVTADFRVDIPGEWTGVTNGSAELDVDGGWRFSTAPGLDIPVTLLGKFRKTDAPGYVIYDTRETSDSLPELVESTAACTSYLNDRFGDVDPLPEAKIVVHDREQSGYSRKTLIALSKISGRDKSRLMQFICHELAHYWSMRGAANTVENWLNETFADYVALMAVREHMGQDVFESFLARYRQQLDEAGDLPPIWTPENQERGPYLVQYRKGPLALATLEERLGRDLFAQFVHRYMTEEIATTPALLEALEDVAGADARAQFEMDLAQTGPKEK